MNEPGVMQTTGVRLAREASNDSNNRRFIAYDWDESLPLEDPSAVSTSLPNGPTT